MSGINSVPAYIIDIECDLAGTLLDTCYQWENVLWGSSRSSTVARWLSCVGFSGSPIRNHRSTSRNLLNRGNSQDFICNAWNSIEIQSMFPPLAVGLLLRPTKGRHVAGTKWPPNLSSREDDPRIFPGRWLLSEKRFLPMHFLGEREPGTKV